tara:strand:+ start:4142 stop:5440 length:1299 start_codon:yes stop_codon:yes gene_type:complete
MIYGHIYKITFPNGKYYIGLTSRTLEKRWNQHNWCAKSTKKKHKKNLLYNAIRKYNMIDNFQMEEIDRAESKEELCKKEITLISMYNTHYIDGDGYNMTYGGDGFNGYIFTETDKQKMSNSRKEYYKNTPGALEKNREIKIKYYEDNPEEKKRFGERMKKLWENPEYHKKMCEMIKKRYENPKYRQKMSEISKKYWNGNEEAKNKMSSIKKEICNKDEWRNSQSERIKEVHKNNPELAIQHGKRMKEMHKKNPELALQHSERLKKYWDGNEEAKKKMSEIVKKRCEDHEYRQKLSDGQKIRFKRQEERNKLSDIHKQRFANDPSLKKKLSEVGKKNFQEHPERLEKMSTMGKALWKDPEYKIKMLNARGKNKPFDVFKKDKKETIFIKSFNYQFEAMEYLQKTCNIKKSINICQVLQGKRKSSAGFIFKYKE